MHGMPIRPTPCLLSYVRRICQYTRFLAVLLVMILVSATATDPEPPVWPDLFGARAVQNRTGRLGDLTLWYDWRQGRTLNAVHFQQGNTIWSIEFSNGTSYYVDIYAGKCKTIKFPVGILRPDWLSNATYLGVETVDTFACHKWTKADFITYWASVETGNPIRWQFFDGAQCDILGYYKNVPLPEAAWQVPAVCFREDVEEVETFEDALRSNADA